MHVQVREESGIIGKRKHARGIRALVVKRTRRNIGKKYPIGEHGHRDLASILPHMEHMG